MNLIAKIFKIEKGLVGITELNSGESTINHLKKLFYQDFEKAEKYVSKAQESKQKSD